MKSIVVTLFALGMASIYMVPVAGIIGGQPSNSPQRFPYQASLRPFVNGPIYCGAVIIGPRRVLTAAGCVAGRSLDDIIVGTGSNTQNVQLSHEVAIVRVHPNYNAATQLNDLAVLITKSLILPSDRVQPIALDSTPIGGGVPVVFSGWGQTIQSFNPNFLQFVNTVTITNDECGTIIGGALGPGEMCTRGEANVAACSADAGGPLARSIGGLVAVASFGTGCNRPGTPTLYTRVAPYKGWIEAQTSGY